MSPENTTVLVVDDEEDICQNLADILSDLGYQVDVAHDGEAALQLLTKKPFDVALLDLKMPGMDGLTLYREIRKLRPQTVAIVITAYASRETVTEVLDAGAWQVLPKPLDFPKLLEALEEATGQPLILVVDDDPALCANLWDLLRERGYRVALAHDAATAVRCVSDQSFRVVLIDMKLPQGDGGRVFEAVRDNNPGTRTVVVTGLPQEMGGLVQRLLDEGADAVCYKPFDVPGLLDMVRKLASSS